MSVQDARELMCPELGKWGKIAMILNSSKGEGDVERDRDAYKYKWSTLLSDFKKIRDFHSRTGRNSEEYFTETTSDEKKLHKLPKAFYLSAYRNMADWLKDKATMRPPHARDTMDPADGNFQSPILDDIGIAGGFLDSMGDEGMWPVDIGPTATHIDLTASESPVISSAQSHRGLFQNLSAGAMPVSAQATFTVADLARNMGDLRSPQRMRQEMDLNAPPAPVVSPLRSTPAPLRASSAGLGAAASAPAGTFPAVSRQGRRVQEIHVLSSTATSAAAELRKAIGSTGHKRKRTAEGSAIADGVTKSAEQMVRALSDINDTQKSTEKEKLQVQSQLFHQNLEYKRERDRLNLENTRIVQEHTRLGLMNQTMVVQAIANLASAISRSVGQVPPPTPPNDSNRPVAVPPAEEPNSPAPSTEPEFINK